MTKKSICKLVVVLLVLSMVFAVCGCGKKLTEENLAGIWVGSWIYEGAEIQMGMSFENGTYYKVTYRNGSLFDSEQGTYEIKGKEVVVYKDGNTGVSKRYKYNGKTLENNGHEFSKSE